MKKIKILMAFLVCLLLSNCASSYKKIAPETLNYSSRSNVSNLVLEYKYDLLSKKYKKKEADNNIKLVAIKITNNSNFDYIFGNNLNLSYENGDSVLVLESEQTFQIIRQRPATYLWFLLLAPVQLYSGTTTNSYGQTEATNSFPIGLILGPGIAAGNMIAASDANKNFKNDLTKYSLIGKTIKKGETAYGLLGIQSRGYESLKLKL
jgi:hypothetical protein